MMSKVAYTFRRATLQDVAHIVQITNDAFMADAFFKKPEFIVRYNEDGVKDMVSHPDENGVFLLASDDGGDNTVGSIHVEPIKKVETENGSPQIVGGFSAVSVPEKHGKRGIGAFLVNSAEEYVLSVARETFPEVPAAEILMQMGVVNVREDLFPWYERQGYSVVSQERKKDPEFDQIVKSGMDVYCVQMRKKIA